jgi:SRSO17 transposase
MRPTPTLISARREFAYQRHRTNYCLNCPLVCSFPLWSGALLKWEQELSALNARLAPAFDRAETRTSAGAFIDGLLSGVTRKTGWQPAKQAGLSRPYRMQSLIGRRSWSAEALRDKVREEMISTLGDPNGVLVVDETCFLKKGAHSVCVARQYSGTAGRIENCQVGVFLATPVVWDRR